MGYGQANNASIKKTVVGRAIHAPHSRQPIIPQQGTGYGANFTAKVPATKVINPFSRLPQGY